MGTTLKYRAGGQIQFVWDSSSGATSYRLYYGTSSGSYSGSYPVTGTSFNYAARSGTWYFAVRAVNDNGESGNSNEVSGSF